MILDPFTEDGGGQAILIRVSHAAGVLHKVAEVCSADRY